MVRIFDFNKKIILSTCSVILWGMSFSQTHSWNYRQCRDNCDPPFKCSTLEKAEQCAKECPKTLYHIVDACHRNAQRLAGQTSPIEKPKETSQPSLKMEESKQQVQIAPRRRPLAQQPSIHKTPAVPMPKMEESRQHAQAIPSPHPLPQTESKPLVTFEELPEITLELPKIRKKDPETKVEQQFPPSQELAISPSVEEAQQQPLQQPLGEKILPESTLADQIQEPQMPLPKADIIAESTPDSTLPAPPLKPTNSQEWRYTIAAEVNKYFGKPYTNETLTNYQQVTRTIGGKLVTVYRPNHALAHGLRKLFIANDIVSALNEAGQKGLDPSLLSPEGQSLIKWVQQKIQEDPNFIQKVETVSAFQRTGRQSEATSSRSPTLYERYLIRDALFFQDFANNYVGPGKLFKDEDELKIYYSALMPTVTNPKNPKLDLSLKNTPDCKFLTRILQASHYLDLRRLSARQVENKEDVCKFLFGDKQSQGEIARSICNNLWERSGEYLDATGDKNFGHTGVRRQEYEDKFFILSNDPQALVNALTEARDKSIIKDFTAPPSMKARTEMSTLSPPHIFPTQEQKAIGIAPVKPQLPRKVSPPTPTAKSTGLPMAPKVIEKTEPQRIVPIQQPQQVAPAQKEPSAPPLATKPDVSQMVSPPATPSMSGTVGACPQNVPTSVELQIEHRCPKCQGSALSEKYKFYIEKVGPMARHWEGYIANTDKEPDKKDKMLRRFHYLASFMDSIAQAERKYCDYIPMFAGGDVALAFLTHLNRALEDITKGRISNPFEAGDKPRELSDRFSDTEPLKLTNVKSVMDYLRTYKLSLLSESGTNKPKAKDLLSKFASVSFSMLDAGSGDSAFDYFLHHTNINLNLEKIGDITKEILKRYNVFPDNTAYNKLIQSYNQVIDKVLILYLVHKSKVNEVVYLAKSWGEPFNRADNFKNYTLIFIENYQRQSKQDFLNSVNKANLPGTREIPTSVNNGVFQGRLLQTSPLLKDENSIKYYLYYAPTPNAMKEFEIKIQKLYYQLALQIVDDIIKSKVESINDVLLKNLDQLQMSIKSNLEQLESQVPQQIAVGQ